MRLEGLRNWIRAGNDPDPEILRVKEALRAEQSLVRRMIDRLRRTAPRADGDLTATAARLLPELASNWGVTIEFAPGEPITVSAEMAHDVAHLFREAVANAVRHGRASAIAAALNRHEGTIWLTVDDNGCGFALGTRPEAPRSIRERLDRLGGSLGVDTGPSGTRLSMAIPQGG